jgi:para-nitrobenzyl esterase
VNMFVLYFGLMLLCRGQIVNLDYGRFQGKDSLFTRQYLGIPYAAPPIGDLRFEQPRPPIPFQGLKNAMHHGKACYQRRDAPPLFGFMLEISEDCLNLNIWAPKGHSADDDPLPVLVWLLPGGFTSGYVANPLYSKFHAFDTNYRWRRCKIVVILL